MFIPPKKYIDTVAEQKDSTSQTVSLRNDHIYLPARLVSEVYGELNNVAVVYYAERRTLLIAKEDDEHFKALHKTRQYMLKSVNLTGDRSIAIQDLLIDNDLHGESRTLAYEAQPALGTLKVVL